MMEKNNEFSFTSRKSHRISAFGEEPLLEHINEPTQFPTKSFTDNTASITTQVIQEKNTTSSNKHFEIYKDPPMQNSVDGNANASQQESLKTVKTSIGSTESRKKFNRYRGLRIISDTILSKRNISSDNEINTSKIAELNTPPDFTENVGKNRKVNSNETKNLCIPSITTQRYRIPLKRRPLAQISPHIDSADGHKFGTRSQQIVKAENPTSEESSSDNDFGNSSDKENIYPDLEIEEPSIESDNSFESKKYDDANSKYGEVLLFTPQHYWNLTFARKQTGTSVSLEDFHLLLYDYEKLWNRYVEDECASKVT